MTALLLDTTFLIDVERDNDTLDMAVDDEDDVAIAAVTLAELQVGVELATSRHRADRAAFVSTITSAMPILAYDTATVLIHAELLAETRRSGRRRGAHDLIIAATARASGRAVVSADPTGFGDLPGVDLHLHS